MNFVGDKMKNLKTLALVAAMALSAPISASALSFYGDIGNGGTYSFSSGEQNLIAQAIAAEGAGSFTFNVTNDMASTGTFKFGVPFLNNSLPGGTFSFGPTLGGASASGLSSAFDLALLAGETATITVMYNGLSKGDVLGARFSAVPLPAGIVLLLSALGMTALVRGRKNGPAAA